MSAKDKLILKTSSSWSKNFEIKVNGCLSTIPSRRQFLNFLQGTSGARLELTRRVICQCRWFSSNMSTKSTPIRECIIFQHLWVALTIVLRLKMKKKKLFASQVRNSHDLKTHKETFNIECLPIHTSGQTGKRALQARFFVGTPSKVHRTSCLPPKKKNADHTWGLNKTRQTTKGRYSIKYTENIPFFLIEIDHFLLYICRNRSISPRSYILRRLANQPVSHKNREIYTQLGITWLSVFWKRN